MTDGIMASRQRRGGLARLLIIAGSDSGGGAGIQADLRTCAAHGVFGTTAITAVTAQNTVGVQSVSALEPALVAAQMTSVIDDIGADAIKIGMLANAEIVHAVADALEHLESAVDGVPIVLDPVMIAKSGDALLHDHAIAALVARLLPLATVVTPNVPELARLVGAEPATQDDARIEQARTLARDLSDAAKTDSVKTWVLAKGGHSEGATLVDVLVDAQGECARWQHPRQRSRATHGTGCTLSSALACRLAQHAAAGKDVRAAIPDATSAAIDYLQGAIAAAVPIGAGHGPVDHLWQHAARTELS